MHNNLQHRSHINQKRKIGAFNKKGTLQLSFDSATDAAIYMLNNGSSKSFRSAVANICVAAKLEDKYGYGYYWRWLA